jgi:DNA-directed RNA polymerase subunit RPC12/RpoP
MQVGERICCRYCGHEVLLLQGRQLVCAKCGEGVGIRSERETPEAEKLKSLPAETAPEDVSS